MTSTPADPVAALVAMKKRWRATLTANEGNVPALLRKLPHWVAGRLSMPKKPGGKVQKIPMRSRPRGRLASSTAPDSWCTFDVTRGVFLDGYEDGFGFILLRGSRADGTDLIGIDLDGCRDPVTGEIAPWAQEIVDALPTYWEVSPSGTGLRGFLLGELPPDHRRKDLIEIYDSERFLTITGDRLPGAAVDVVRLDAEVLALHQRLWPPTTQAPLRARDRGPGLSLDDEEVLSKARSAKNGAKFAAAYDTPAGEGDDHSLLDMHLCCRLVWWTGRDPAQVDRLFRRSALMREKWDEKSGKGTYGDRTIARAMDKTPECYSPTRRRPEAHRASREATDPGEDDAAPAPPQDLPTVVLSELEHEVTDQLIAALATHPSLYQRAGGLVDVIEDRVRQDDGDAAGHTLRIRTMPVARIRELTTAVSSIKRWVEDEETGEMALVPAHPPPWSAPAIHQRGVYTGVRTLTGITEVPVMRADWTVLSEPGFDAASGLLLRSNGALIPVPERPDRAAALRALDELLEVFCDFPFKTAAHLSAMLAATLTPFVRFAIDAPAPFNMVTASTAGSGKGKACNCVAIFVTGREMPVTTFPTSEEEVQKQITSWAKAGDQLAMFDNVTTRLGGPNLEAAVTSTSWNKRQLGGNDSPKLPLHVTMFGTANNPFFTSDFSRRVNHVRLESPLERPEERDPATLKHPDLLAWVKRERFRLVAAVLTLLRAYVVAGRPDMKLPPWGSFEAWSLAVRAPLVWLGLPDPAAARDEMRAEADTTGAALRTLLAGLDALYGPRWAFSARDLHKMLESDVGGHHAGLREALEELAGGKALKDMSTLQVGNVFRKHKGRPVDGRRLHLVSQRAGGAKVASWVVLLTGDSIPPDPPESPREPPQPNQPHSQANHPSGGIGGINPESIHTRAPARAHTHAHEGPLGEPPRSPRTPPATQMGFGNRGGFTPDPDESDLDDADIDWGGR